MGMDGWREIGKHSFTPLSLEETLLGGQSFVWTKKGSHQWRGVIGRSIVDLSLRNGRLSWRASLLHPFSEGELTKYLWIDGSYDAAIEEMPWRSDPVLRESLRAFSGLRILGQPLMRRCFTSFEFGQSISQIKSCGEAVALRYGESLVLELEVFRDGTGFAKFRRGTLLKLGYRAKYAAGWQTFWPQGVVGLRKPLPCLTKRPRPVNGNAWSWSKNCGLRSLFGAGKLEAFPIDTWMDKSLERRYGLEGWSLSQKLTFARVHFGKFAGLAQQFLFSSERRGIFA